MIGVIVFLVSILSRVEGLQFSIKFENIVLKC